MVARQEPGKNVNLHPIDRQRYNVHSSTTQNGLNSRSGRQSSEKPGKCLRRLVSGFFKQLHSLKIKLILPYVILTLFTAMTGTYVVTRLVSSSARERFMNQLYEASRVAADGVLRTERTHLADLRLMAYTSGVSDAILNQDEVALQNLLWPLVLNNAMEAVSVLDLDGMSLLTMAQDPNSGQTILYTGEDFSSVRIVQAVLQREQDELGDKFSGFIDTRAGTYLFSSAPVKDETGKLVGVLLVGTRGFSLVSELKQQILADLIFLDAEGKLLTTSFTEVEEGNESLQLTQEQMIEIEDNPITALEINQRQYLAAYTPLMVREELVGYKGIALCSEYLIDTEITSRNIFSIIFSAATIGVILIGFFLSRSIAAPILHLQSVARSIAEGDLEQRSGLQRKDEVGQLAAVVDLMTFRLRRRTAQAAKLYAETVERNEELNRINERLQSTQQQLIQSEKLAAVGQLTAGIVHDVKNPLAVIKGLAEEMEEDHTFNESGQKTLKTIRDSASRATRIVSDLLTFARQSTPTMQRQNIVDTVKTALRMTDYLTRKGRVQVQADLPEQQVLLEYDAQQIEQVLINLIQNAIQAMPDGGKLLLSVKPEGLHTRIIVQDNGVGIPAEYLRRIFDPFFTTKKEGEGTGLGLSVSYGIITKHGGSIDVESEPGQGTRFVITMPNGVQEGKNGREENSGS
ncbi:MAG: HAMP domain-containing protein [Anaerolineales bacterium]|nr:HAMP domain-containing protein [Anaerolineales bacterium]